ncbi:IclR family transcriptional regulator [Geobacillus stearothermophilus]|uniref:IclR family transcriptional regulator n=1 Tax=Geobacillus stearothermophilus TaxID=1422 RepID=UPI002E1B4C88|nr:IclR family transcriptional regulator [Geobacillus stearothermophilus]MED4962407.1 IclR family transcriptional regulator [Geobacillus stearothermophilus]
MNKTVLKTKELLDLFLDCERLTLPEMVERLQMPKTSVYRMAQSLVALGFLQKRGDHYELGLALLTFGSLVAERLDIRRVALPVMERLKEATNEAVNLVIRDGDEALYIEKVETSEPVRVYTKVGRRALLVFMDEKEQARYLERTKLVKIAKNTVTDKQALRRQLEEDRKRGYTVSYSELENYSAAVAVPIFNHEGAAIAGLSVAGPEQRFLPNDVARIVPLLRQAAMEISRELGFQGKGWQ